MSKKLVIIGTGGFGREVLELIEDINDSIVVNQRYGAYSKYYDILGFIDTNQDLWGKEVNGYKVLGDEYWITEYNTTNFGSLLNVAIGIGSPEIKRKVIQKLRNVQYPNLIHPSAKVGKHGNSFGVGNIITAGCVLTCNVTLGNHVMTNLNTTIGHDAVIQDYVVMSPGVNLSGNTVLEEGAYIGNGASILEKKTVGAWSIIGGLALVNSDVPKNSTAVGVPAKVIKTRDDGWHL